MFPISDAAHVIGKRRYIPVAEKVQSGCVRQPRRGYIAEAPVPLELVKLAINPKANGSQFGTHISRPRTSVFESPCGTAIEIASRTSSSHRI